jgi:hypothetical protein
MLLLVVLESTPSMNLFKKIVFIALPTTSLAYDVCDATKQIYKDMSCCGEGQKTFCVSPSFSSAMVEAQSLGEGASWPGGQWLRTDDLGWGGGDRVQTFASQTHAKLEFDILATSAWFLEIGRISNDGSFDMKMQLWGEGGYDRDFKCSDPNDCYWSGSYVRMIMGEMTGHVTGTVEWDNTAKEIKYAVRSNTMDYSIFRTAKENGADCKGMIDASVVIGDGFDAFKLYTYDRYSSSRTPFSESLGLPGKEPMLVKSVHVKDSAQTSVLAFDADTAGMTLFDAPNAASTIVDNAFSQEVGFVNGWFLARACSATETLTIRMSAHLGRSFPTIRMSKLTFYITGSTVDESASMLTTLDTKNPQLAGLFNVTWDSENSKHYIELETTDIAKCVELKEGDTDLVHLPSGQAPSSFSIYAWNGLESVLMHGIKND